MDKYLKTGSSNQIKMKLFKILKFFNHLMKGLGLEGHLPWKIGLLKKAKISWKIKFHRIILFISLEIMMMYKFDK